MCGPKTRRSEARSMARSAAAPRRWRRWPRRSSLRSTPETVARRMPWAMLLSDALASCNARLACRSMEDHTCSTCVRKAYTCSTSAAAHAVGRLQRAVGDLVGDAAVDLVTEPGEHRQRRRGDGRGDGLVIERRQLGLRAAAADQHDDIEVVVPGQRAKCARDHVDGPFALHAHVDDPQAERQARCGRARG